MLKSMMEYRSETIGSLLRPQYLVDARQQLERGELTAPAFKRIEDRAVDESVALQEAAGLDVVTDGEQRRYAFFGHLVESFEGFDKFGGWAIPFRDDAGVEETIKRPVVVDKLRWRRHMAAEEFTYLRARTNRPIKVTLLSAQQAAACTTIRTSPARLTRRATPIWPTSSTSRGAKSRSCSAWDASISRSTRRSSARSSTEKIREGYRQRGSDPDRLLDTCIELDNALIDGHAGVTFGIHICRGNYRSMFYAWADTIALRSRCSAGPTSTASCSSMTPPGPGRSSRWPTCRTIVSWCWGS
jgi:5-methyltetrahydropteroyltriglutamate--homocysteine methyltransferase